MNCTRPAKSEPLIPATTGQNRATHQPGCWHYEYGVRRQTYQKGVHDQIQNYSGVLDIKRSGGAPHVECCEWYTIISLPLSFPSLHLTARSSSFILLTHTHKSRKGEGQRGSHRQLHTNTSAYCCNPIRQGLPASCGLWEVNMNCVNMKWGEKKTQMTKALQISLVCFVNENQSQFIPWWQT